MAKREIEIGPAGRAVAEQFAARRRLIGWTQAEVSEGARVHGHMLTTASVGEIERLARRVDLDDFVAICLALTLDPARVIDKAMDDADAELRRRLLDTDAEMRQALERVRELSQRGGWNPRGKLPTELPYG